MYLYLVRHGDAVEPYIDPKRPLSEIGENEVDRLGSHLAALGLSVQDIWHSEYFRAEQTAARLAGALGAKNVKLHPNLGPGDPVGPIAETVMALEDDLMLVGHLPFMGLLASLLLTRNEDKADFAFGTATAACIEIQAATARLRWMLPAGLCAPLPQA